MLAPLTRLCTPEKSDNVPCNTSIKDLPQTTHLSEQITDQVNLTTFADTSTKKKMPQIIHN